MVRDGGGGINTFGWLLLLREILLLNQTGILLHLLVPQRDHHNRLLLSSRFCIQPVPLRLMKTDSEARFYWAVMKIQSRENDEHLSHFDPLVVEGMKLAVGSGHSNRCNVLNTNNHFFCDFTTTLYNCADLKSLYLEQYLWVRTDFLIHFRFNDSSIYWQPLRFFFLICLWMHNNESRGKQCKQPVDIWHNVPFWTWCQSVKLPLLI